LIKEGTEIKKNMVVARFDSKPFLDNLQKAEQAYADARAASAAAEKMLALQKEEEEGKIEEATRKLEIAKIQAESIRSGSGPLKRKTLEQQVHQAERTLELCQSDLKDLDVLLAKGHVSAMERNKAADKVSSGKEQLAVAKAELDNFNTYGWPQMQREAQLLLDGAKSNLERVKRSAELLVQNRQAEVEKSRRNEEAKLAAFNLAKTDIASCEVLSPTDGILLYPELPRENGRRKIQIGDSVWVGQTFLEVPDTTALIAEIHIREVDVAKIAAGMEARIEVDAFPGRTYKGVVDSVASLAKEDDSAENLRRFSARLRLVDDTENIHVGMSVTTRIVYRQVKDAIVVPLGAVSYRGGEAMVRRTNADGAQDVSVSVGERGQLWAEISNGLAEGDLVYAEAQ
jgi:multidrug resistance efflux pump